MDTQTTPAEASRDILPANTCDYFGSDRCSSQFTEGGQQNDLRQDSRRSVDWRDSGIVIDDDHPFYSIDTICDISSRQSIESHQQQSHRQQQSASTTQATTSGGSTFYLSQNSFAQDCDDDGDTLLHLAVVGCTLEKVKDLIRSSPSLSSPTGYLDAINNMLHTPMHVATMANRPEMVQLLLDSGAKCDIQDRRGNSPLHKACEKGFNEIVVIILDHVKRTSDAIEINNSVDCVRKQLEMANFDGQTCLHLAAIHDRRQTLEILVNRYGARINCHDSKSGETILHKAVQRCNVELVEFILNLGQQHCNESDYSYRTPLDQIKLLRESGIAQCQDHNLAKIAQLISNRIEICSQQNGCCALNTERRQPIGELLDTYSDSSSSTGSDYEESSSEVDDSEVRINGQDVASSILM